MLNVSNIPTRLLIHSVVLSDEQLDDWGYATAINSVQIGRVRVEPYDTFKSSVNKNTEEELKAVLFYDCKNSTPRDVVFRLKQRVEFDDVIYHIKSIDKLHSHVLHHLEVGLV